MAKRVLIISYYFAPQNQIGAIRPTKLAKYLAAQGNEVTVICGAGMNAAKDPTLARDLQELRDVHIIKEWNPLRAYKARRQRSAGAPPSAHGAGSNTQQPGLVHRMTNALYLFLCVLADRSFQRRATRELGKLTGGYDAVFSTYAPISVHLVARAAKRRGLAKRWIADFRDEVGMSFGWQEGYRKRCLSMLRREADLLTAVSDGFLEMMGFTQIGRVLSNGFDRDDLRDVQPERPAGEPTFRVVYCGQLVEGRRNVPNRDIAPFFRAMRALVNEGVCAADELQFVYAGREGALYRAYAARAGLEERVENCGQVTRERSLALQLGADALLMASWNLSGQTGILTGKLFEYMMMEKPILCCMAGDLCGSEAKRVLEETGLGFCAEAAAGEADERALTDYLRKILLCWKQGKTLLLSKNEAQTEKYNYCKLAAQLDGWMERGR
ncbi:MAG: hypothetical protein RR521_00140 [Clostridia bacterium]